MAHRRAQRRSLGTVQRVALAQCRTQERSRKVLGQWDQYNGLLSWTNVRSTMGYSGSLPQTEEEPLIQSEVLCGSTRTAGWPSPFFRFLISVLALFFFAFPVRASCSPGLPEVGPFMCRQHVKTWVEWWSAREARDQGCWDGEVKVWSRGWSRPMGVSPFFPSFGCPLSPQFMPSNHGFNDEIK